MWRPCEYHEWRGTLPWEGGLTVCATVAPLEATPRSVTWVELVDADDPREVEAAHGTLRTLVFWEWEADACP